MRNRWLNALIKTIIFWIASHIVFQILGFFIRTDVGIFNLPMMWAHWSDNYGDMTIGIIATIILYFVIYFFFTGKDTEQIEHS